jgi:hypothetical protein
VTLIVCWQRDRRINCLADARLTLGQRWERADVGSKVAVVPLMVWAMSETNYAPAQTHSVGFAYAGSSLIAANTHLKASSICQMLRAEGHPKLPSLEAVAHLFAKVAESITRDVRATQPKAAAEMAVFGICPGTDEPRIFHIDPRDQDGLFAMDVSEFHSVAGSALVFGSGSKLFEKVGLELYEGGTPRGAAEVFVRALRHPDAVDAMIGGLPEWISADEVEARIPIVLNFGLEPDEGHTESVLGFPIDDLGPVDGLGIGFQATEPDWLYRLGERILRDRGVEEAEIGRRESLRDLACIEYLVDLNRQLPPEAAQKIIPGTFYLSAFDPTGGEWCYCGRCRSCAAEVPLFSDSSNGEENHPLIGAELVSQCPGCGTGYRETSFNIFPHLWPKKVGHAILR